MLRLLWFGGRDCSFSLLLLRLLLLLLLSMLLLSVSLPGAKDLYFTGIPHRQCPTCLRIPFRPAAVHQLSDKSQAKP